MKAIACAVLLSAALPLSALGQTADEIKNADKTPQNVLTYGMSYSQQRFSPLTQINRDTVKRLVPAWSYSLNNNTGEESQPLVYNGVMYVTSHNKTVAVDALTGKEIWNTPIEYPSDTTRVVCCGIVNRGAAIYEGKIFRTTLDARVIALDMKTGKEIWNTKSGDAKDGIAMTGAPLIANGVLITGMAGAEYGSRGYIEGYDPKTGKRLWRRYTVPRPGEPGAKTWPNDAANASGGSIMDHRHLRSRARPRVLGHRQSGAVERAAAQGRRSLHQHDHRGAAEDRRAGVALSDVAQRSVRPRQHHVDHPGRPHDRGQADQGAAAGGAQRLLLRARAQDRPADRREPLRQGHLGDAASTRRPAGRNGPRPPRRRSPIREEIETWPHITGGTNWFPNSFNPRTGARLRQHRRLWA